MRTQPGSPAADRFAAFLDEFRETPTQRIQEQLPSRDLDDGRDRGSRVPRDEAA